MSNWVDKLFNTEALKMMLEQERLSLAVKEELLRLFEAAGLNRSDVCARVEMDRRRLDEILDGDLSPTLHEVAALAWAARGKVALSCEVTAETTTGSASGAWPLRQIEHKYVSNEDTGPSPENLGATSLAAA